MLWKKEITVKVLSFSPHHIDSTVHVQGGNQNIRLTGLYEWADATQRSHTWELIGDYTVNPICLSLSEGTIMRFYIGRRRRGVEIEVLRKWMHFDMHSLILHSRTWDFVVTLSPGRIKERPRTLLDA